MARGKIYGDLLYERDKTPWYWRVLGTLSSLLILLGFLVFPTSFPDSTNTNARQSTLSIIAVILLALGYSLSVALWFICRSWIFQFDVLFVPCLLSCIAGALNTGITLGVHPAASSQWGPAPISALALALGSSFIYGTLCVFTHLRVYKVRLYTKHKPHGPLGEREDGSESATLISQEDAQRKQFGRLLSQSERSSPVASAANTYHVDIPDAARLGGGGGGSGRGGGSSRRSHPPHSPTQLHDSGRSISPYSDHSIHDTSTAAAAAAYTPVAPARTLEGSAAALQAARERSIHNQRSRDRMLAAAGKRPAQQQQQQHPQQQQQQQQQPPGSDIGDISLSDIHPLERSEVLRVHDADTFGGGGSSRGGSAAGGDAGGEDKPDQFGGLTYRPPSSDGGFEQPRFEIVEDAPDVRFDLGVAGRRATRDLRGAGVGVGNGVGNGNGAVGAELEARMPRERMSGGSESRGTGSWRD